MSNRVNDTKELGSGNNHGSECDHVFRKPEIPDESDSYKDGVEEAKRLSMQFRKELNKKKVR